MTLDQLPVSESFSPRAPIGPDQNADAQATFVAQVAGKAKELGYRIADQRIFVCVGYVPTIGPQWAVLRSEVGNVLLTQHEGKEVYDRASSEGPAYISVWRLPKQQTIALSQSFDLDDGKVLVGYFMLEKQ